MIKIQFKHNSVLLNESVNGLHIKDNGIYVDATLGGGGHTQKILSYLKNGHLYSIDLDSNSIKYNNDKFNDYILNNKLTIIKGNFRNLRNILLKYNIHKIDGIIYDLGVSSPQLDDPNRGFSYKLNSKLDMRMDQSQSLTAYEVINDWSYNDLVKIFFKYGNEHFAKSIAKKIVRRRDIKPIVNTVDLANLINSCIPYRIRKKRGFPAKKSFQAIRIAVNDELSSLKNSINTAIDLLNPYGRIVVITFQPKEDSIVQHIFKENSSYANIPRGLPIIPKEYKNKLRIITHKPILPSQDELNFNHRSHSAKLRIAEKI